MRVNYHAGDGTIYEIHAPNGTEITYRSHVRDESGRFLDDLLVVAWRGKKIGLEGDVVCRVAREKLLGMNLVRVSRTSDARSGAPRD